MRRWQNLWPRSRQPSLEIHVPISPTPTFFNMLRCLAHSLRRYGGAYCDALIVATVGCSDGDSPHWSRTERFVRWWRGSTPPSPPRVGGRRGGLRRRTKNEYALNRLGVELRWLPPEDFLARDYFATGHQRFKYRHRADVVLLLDADILIAGPIDELVHMAHRQQAIAGLIAHLCPFERAGQHDVDWKVVFRHCGLEQPELGHQYTGWGLFSNDERRRNCPAYFNYGVVCAPRALCKRIAPIIAGLFDRVREICPTVYAAQIALAVAIAHLKLPAIALPTRWNCPNVPELEALQPSEVSQAKILHLLGQRVNKNEVFAGVESLREFAAVPGLTGTNARAQEIIREILPGFVTEERRFAA